MKLNIVAANKLLYKVKNNSITNSIMFQVHVDLNEEKVKVKARQIKNGKISGIFKKRIRVLF